MSEEQNNRPLPKREKNSVAPFIRDIIVDGKDDEEEDNDDAGE